MASDTTSIFELPSDPMNGGNISMNIHDKNNVVQPHGQPPGQPPTPNFQNPPSQQGPAPSPPVDPSLMGQLLNGLQQATQMGATLLPSRDIPMNTQPFTTDPQITPNYIPPHPTHLPNYIDAEESQERILQEYNKKQKTSHSIDQMYDEIQTPLLLAILYFLFQLPIVRAELFRYFPFLFLKDGNPNISGFLFMSFLYGLLFYILHKSIKNFYI